MRASTHFETISPMTSIICFRSGARRAARWGAAALLVMTLPLAGCSTDEVLSVTDPDILNPGDLASPAGANAIYLGTLARLTGATSGGESFFLFGGLLADEWRSGDTFVQRNETDKRDVQVTNSLVTTAYRQINRTRVAAQQAVQALTKYDPNNDRYRIAEMYFVQGYTEVLMAEHLCEGIPLSSVDLESGKPTYSKALPIDTVLARAEAHFDTALAVLQSETGSKATAIRHAAAIGLGRARLNQGDFAGAAAAVAAVPANYQYLIEHSLTSTSNQIWSLNTSARRYTVSPGEGTNGIPFATAGDPRLPVGAMVAKGSFDQTTDFYPQRKWDQVASVAIASGVEAELIEAEAKLQPGGTAADVADFFTIHNALRATVTGLDPVADTGVLATQAGRENFHFRERAFWLFGTGYRLGDLRRLVSQYGRAPTTVFPVGDFFKGGTYGDDVNFPVVQAEDNNPEFDRSACIAANP